MNPQEVGWKGKDGLIWLIIGTAAYAKVAKLLVLHKVGDSLTMLCCSSFSGNILFDGVC